MAEGTEFESCLRDLAQGVGEFTCVSQRQEFVASAEDLMKLTGTKGSRRFIKSRNCCLCRKSDEETVVGMMLIASLLHHTRKEKFSEKGNHSNSYSIHHGAFDGGLWRGRNRWSVRKAGAGS